MGRSTSNPDAEEGSTMICEPNQQSSKMVTILKIRSKGDRSKKPAFAPRDLKKVIPVNLRSNPTL